MNWRKLILIYGIRLMWIRLCVRMRERFVCVCERMCVCVCVSVGVCACVCVCVCVCVLAVWNRQYKLWIFHQRTHFTESIFYTEFSINSLSHSVCVRARAYVYEHLLNITLDYILDNTPRIR